MSGAASSSAAFTPLVAAAGPFPPSGDRRSGAELSAPASYFFRKSSERFAALRAARDRVLRLDDADAENIRLEYIAIIGECPPSNLSRLDLIREIACALQAQACGSTPSVPSATVATDNGKTLELTINAQLGQLYLGVSESQRPAEHVATFGGGSCALDNLIAALIEASEVLTCP